MVKLPILKVPDRRLRQLAVAVEGVCSEVTQLMDDMLETMYAASGIGLAAPQVGVLKRVLVIDVAQQKSQSMPLCLANPDIVWSSSEKSVYNEGCLSLPNQYADINRPSRIIVRYLNRYNEDCELETDGLLSTVIQHEIDHLDGVLFLDYLSRLRRDMIMRRIRKEKCFQQNSLESFF